MRHVAVALACAAGLGWAQLGAAAGPDEAAVAAPGGLTVVGRWAEGPCLAAAVQGNLAYVSNGGYLDVVDVSNPASPHRLGRVLMPLDVRDVVVQDSHAYVVSSSGQLSVVDVSNPANPMLEGSASTLNQAYAVAVSGDYAFVASYILEVFDVSDPSNPTKVGTANARNAYDVVVRDRYAYVAGLEYGLRILDVSDPTAPREVGLIDTGNSFAGARGIALAGNYAYIAATDTGLRVIDVSDPSSPVEVGSLDVGSRATDVAVAGTHALVSMRYVGGDTVRGLRVVDISDPAHPVERGFFDTTAISSCDRVAVSSNRAFLPLPEAAGLAVVDLSIPSSPTEVGRYSTAAMPYRIKVSGGYLYGAAGTLGLVILDVSDPTAPTPVTFFDTPAWVNDVDVVDTTAFLSESYGMRVLNVANPSAPTEIGYFAVADPTKSYQIDRTTRVRVRGRYAYLARYFRFSVLDVANPARPVEVGSADSGYWPTGLEVSGDYAYLGDDYGLVVVDISSPSAPVNVGTSYDPNDPGSSTIGNVGDVAAANGYAYLATYRNGVKIMDMSQPSQPTEVASFLDPPRGAGSVALNGNQLAVAASLHVVDVLDPTTPTELASFSTPGSTMCVRAANDLYYLIDSVTGLYILRYDPSPPELAVSPTSLDFGDTHAQLSLEIRNRGGGTLSWSVAESPDEPWITSVSPSSGTGDATVTVTVDRNQLSGLGDRGNLTVSSNGGSATVEVTIGQVCTVSCSATVPATASEDLPVSFVGSASSSACTGSPSFEWDFGDQSAHATTASANHAYTRPGSYGWTMTARADDAVCRKSGTISVTERTGELYLVPAIAHNAGIGGTQWRTDITAVNRSAATVTVVATYYSAAAPITRTVSLQPGATVEWANVAESLLGIPPGTESQGILHLAADAPLAITSRTFNQSTTGTYGQYLPALTENDAILAGERAVVPHLKRGAGFRTNLGLVNLGEATAVAGISLHDGQGRQVGSTRTAGLEAGRWLQLSDVFGFCGAGDQPIAYAVLTVETGGGKVWAYASVVDNGTGDPTMIPVLRAAGAATAASASHGSEPRPLSVRLDRQRLRPIESGGDLARIATTPVTLTTNGFEGSFPGTGWEVLSNGDTGWGASAERAAEGSRSAWCAGGGTAPSPSGGNYPPNLQTWLVYGPFSLASATAAGADFSHWTLTEPGYDLFGWLVSTDGETYHGYQTSGAGATWQQVAFDFSSVSQVSVLGEPQVWFAFLFQSDGSAQYRGTWVDDVRLEAVMSCSLGCSASAPSSATVGGSVSFQGSATATGCAGTPSYDWDFGDSSAHSSSSSSSHTYAAEGTYTWKLTVTADGASCTKSGTITVGSACSLSCSATAPSTATAGSPVSFQGSATPSGCSGAPAWDWDFGDSSAHSSSQNPSHTYAATGSFSWRFTATLGGATCSRTGSIAVGAASPRQLVAAVAHNAGFGGSQWGTDVVAVNAGSASATVEAIFHADPTELRQTVVLEPGATREWRNVVESLFGQPASAEIQGTLELVTSVPIVVTARTYNQGAQGTFGQYLPAISGEGALTSGQVGVLPALKRNAAYRTNLGVLNLGESAVELRVKLYGAEGNQLGTEQAVFVPARRWLQRSDVFGFVGAGDQDLAYATIEVRTSGGKVWVYGSVVDNATGDPTTIPVLVP